MDKGTHVRKDRNLCPIIKGFRKLRENRGKGRKQDEKMGKSRY